MLNFLRISNLFVPIFPIEILTVDQLAECMKLASDSNCQSSSLLELISVCGVKIED